MFCSLFNYLIQNKFFTECQPGFISEDFCVAQLLSVTQEVCKSLVLVDRQVLQGTP